MTNLLQLLPEPQTLVDVDSQFNFDFVWLCHFYVSLKLFNEPIFVFNLCLEISIVFFELRDQEAFSEMVRALCSVIIDLNAIACIWRGKRLLQLDGQPLKLLISGV